MCPIGNGWRRSPIGFDWLWRGSGDEVGNTPCHGSGDQNGGNGKSQADHFFAFNPVLQAGGWLQSQTPPHF